VNTITLQRMRHRGALRIAISFDFNQELIDRMKAIPGRRWSKSLNCWHVPDHEHTLKILYEQLSGYPFRWIDAEQISTTDETARQDTIDPHKEQSTLLSPEVLCKIEDVARWMRQKRYQEATITTYVSFITKYFSTLPDKQWNDITPDDIVRYNHDYFIAQGRSYSAQNQWINAIKTYIKVHNLWSPDKLESIERPFKSKILPDVLTVREVQDILLQVKNVKQKTLLMLIYSCGLRIGESLALKPSDIRSNEGLIYIRGAKGKKDRRVPLSPRILKQLRIYYKAYAPSKYLFEGQQEGTPYSASSARKVLKRAVKKANITGKRITLHSLRHAYATHLTTRGINLPHIQEILGHADPKTTMLYTHLSAQDIKNVQSPLDDMEL